MRKLLTSIVLGSLFLPVVALADFQTDLYKGMRSNDVEILQEFLVEQNLLSAGNTTGFFGPLTFKALKSYQLSAGLPSTGYFGPLTRSKVNATLLAEGYDATTTDESGVTVQPTSTPDSSVVLQQKIDALTQQIQQQQSTIDQIQQQTAPAVSFGTTQTPVVTPVDKSGIIVVPAGGPGEISKTFPYGIYGYNVSVLDKDGKNVNNAPVTMDGPADVNSINGWSPRIRKTDTITGATGVNTPRIEDNWYASFGYSPMATGTYTLTFTSGSFSKSVTLDVQ